MKILFIVLGIFVMIIYVPSIFGMWLHHRKYPILSASVPRSILQRGDVVDLGNGKNYIFQGREQVNFDLVFQCDEGIYDFVLTQNQFKSRVKSIKNKYGYKWIKQIET